MKKQNKVLLTAMSLSMVLAPTTASIAFAEDNVKETSNISVENNSESILDDSIVNVDNEDYKVLTIENDDSIVTKVTNDQGTIEYKNNKTNNIVTVSSDFLTEEEIKSLEEEANAVELEEVTEENEISTMSLAAASTWHVGKWQNYTITSNGKFTAQSLIGLLGSKFGFTGAAISTIANIAIQYGVKTGYYRVRYDYKILDANYMMQRRTIQLYKDSKRTKLVGTSKQEKKVWVGI